MAADPIHQFQITKLADFGTANLPVFGPTSLAFTNSHLAMTIAFVLVVGMIIGTYSTIYIASPYVLLWQNWRARRKGAARVAPAAVPTPAGGAPVRRATKVRKATSAR